MLMIFAMFGVGLLIITYFYNRQTKQNATMDTLAVSAFAIGATSMMFLCYGIFFLSAPHSNRLRRLLGIIMLVWSALFAKDIYFFFTDAARGTSDFTYKLLMTVDMWCVVTCKLYLIELLRPGRLGLGDVLADVSGFALFTAVYAITGNDAFYFALIAYAAIYSASMLVYIIRATVSYNRMVRQSYSDLSHLDVKWLWLAVGIMIANLLVWFYMYLTPGLDSDAYYCLMICLLWSVIAWKTWHQRIPDEIVDDTAPTTDGIAPCDGRARAAVVHAFSSKLEELVGDGYFYRYPGLTLSELAAELKTNRTTLSAFLNNDLGMTFYEYINNIRLDYAQQLMSQPGARLTQVEVAEMAGFNSLSTFRRALKRRKETARTGIPVPPAGSDTGGTIQ